ncbi:MAG: 2-C-methyl-D-erythritol 2,4-cyclodiphosphate synthase [Endomicrobia bacterium]|nr:2-C-methyl-D-erythritol 2,4-cyclodiphosphate synthase [Endomicrobiia bacterium]
MKKSQKPKIDFRVGYGFDVHRLVEGRKLIIAGIEIPCKKGMLGHSDGDVVIHCVCDAILGAIGAGEIGIYFPPTDLTIMGISSKTIAEKVMQILKNKKGVLNQMDIVIIAEEPKIKPYYEEMKKSLSEIFSLKPEDINIKAKTMEGLGDIGKGEGIICHAVVTIKISQ